MRKKFLFYVTNKIGWFSLFGIGGLIGFLSTNIYLTTKELATKSFREACVMLSYTIGLVILCYFFSVFIYDDYKKSINKYHLKLFDTTKNYFSIWASLFFSGLIDLFFSILYGHSADLIPLVGVKIGVSFIYLKIWYPKRMQEKANQNFANQIKNKQTSHKLNL